VKKKKKKKKNNIRQRESPPSKKKTPFPTLKTAIFGTKSLKKGYKTDKNAKKARTRCGRFQARAV
jgi:hypothetical protein